MSQILDTKGLNCPLPVLKARRALRNLAPGDLLTVHATDPASLIDFQHLCNTSSHELVENAQEGEVFIYVIRRGA